MSIKNQIERVLQHDINIKLIMYFRLICGNYHTAGSFKKNNLLRIYSCLVSLMMKYIFIVQMLQNASSPIGLLLFESTLNFFHSLVIGEAYFFRFCSAIISMDTRLGFKKGFVSRYVYGICVITLSLRVSYFYNMHDWFSCASYIFLVFSHELNNLPKFIMFHILYQRMRLLRKSFEGRFVIVNIIGREKINYRINNIKKCLFVYDDIIQHFSRIDLHLQLWVNILNKNCTY